MRLNLFTTHSVTWFDHKQFLDQIFGLVADVLPYGLFHGVLALFDFLVKFEVVGVVERRLPTQQDIQNYANAPKVTRVIVGPRR